MNPRLGWVALAGAAALAVVIGLWWVQPPEQVCDAAKTVEARVDALSACRQAFVDDPSPSRADAYARSLRASDDLDALLALSRAVDGPVAEARVLAVLGGALAADETVSVQRYREVFVRALELTDPDHATDAARHAYAWLYAEWSRQQLPEAVERGLEAARLAEASGDPESLRKIDLALPSILADVGDVEGAQQRSRAALQRARAQGDLQSEALASNQLGLAAAEDGRLDSARRWYRGALELATASGSPYVYDFLVNLALVELRRGDAEAAAPLVSRLRREFPDRGQTRSRPSRPLVEARFALVEDRAADALSILDEALEGLESAYDVELLGLRGDALERLGRVDEARASYEAAARAVEVRTGSVAEDRFRATAFATSRRPFERLFMLAERPEDKARAFDRAKGRVFLGAASRARWSGTPAAERIRELDRVRPFLSATPPGSEARWPEVRAVIGPRQVLAWLRAEDELHLLVMTRGGVRHVNLGAAAPLEQLVRRVETTPGDGALLAEAGARLLPTPIELDPDQTLHLVPDGALARIPIGILPLDGAPLLESHRLSYVPNLSALAAMNSRPTASDGTAPAILAAGADLPEVTEEARWVGARLRAAPVFGAQRADLFASSTATVLHIASHAGLNRGSAWIELADGPVRPSEILSKRVAPRLVVLASCTSAARAGGELWGSMAASFLAAGARHVVASLWSVADEHARELVEVFYDAGGAEDPIGGLARARRRLRAKGRPLETWAPFIVLGADRGSTEP